MAALFGNVAPQLASLMQLNRPYQTGGPLMLPPEMGGPQAPATPMQVPVQSEVLQPTATSQPQTQQGPAYLRQFGQGDGGMMSATNPRNQFDVGMYRRGGKPWQFAGGAMWAPQSSQQMVQSFAQGTMQPEAMPNLSDQQLQALAQMVARLLRF